MKINFLIRDYSWWWLEIYPKIHVGMPIPTQYNGRSEYYQGGDALLLILSFLITNLLTTVLRHGYLAPRMATQQPARIMEHVLSCFN